MGIITDQNADATDFIDEAERNATPANDEGRVAKLEADGRLHPFFTRLGTRQLSAGETLNGASTPIPVYQNKTDNELYACDANDTNKMKFIGFVTSNGTDANPIDFQGAGVVDGFTGLQEGEKYYVQDTAGTIGTTAGTYEVLVGVAISTTQLLIQKGRRHLAGEFNFTDATADQAITLGFRPTRIRLSAVAGSSVSGAHGGVAELVWTPSGTGGIGLFFSQSNETTPYASATIRSSTGSNQVDLSIASVTDTGFTIVLTQTGGLNGGKLLWEAEGDL